MIQFLLLGEISLQSDAGAQLDALLRQPKRLALLAYLVSPSPGTWHRRDSLLALFWPDLDTAHARTSLRNALYVIRQNLGEAVVKTRGDEEVSIDPAMLNTDLTALRTALRERRMEDALGHYRGDLLPGLFPPGSDGFQRWLEGERDRLKLEVAAAGSEWALELERAGRCREAIAAVRRVVEIHPDDETAVRRLMGLHDSVGDRAGALAVFESYRNRLASEFGAEPAPETRALAGRLRAMVPSSPIRSVVLDTHAAAEAAGRESAPEPATRTEPRALPRQHRGRNLQIAVLAAVALALVAVAGARLSRSRLPMVIGSSLALTSDDGLEFQPDISPNGNLVAYAAGDSRRMRIMIRQIGGERTIALSSDSSSVETQPRWSPDASKLLFLSRNGAYVSPALGGSSRLLAAGGVGEDAGVLSAVWSPRGDSVAIVRNDSLLILPLEGAGTRLVAHGNGLHSCAWSPDARWIACVAGNHRSMRPGTHGFGNLAPSGIELYPASGGVPVVLADQATESQSPVWSPEGGFLYVVSKVDGRRRDVYAIPVRHDGHPGGPAVRVTTGLNVQSISLSGDGKKLAYSVYTAKANLWTVPISAGPPLTMAAAVQVTSGSQVIEIVRVSPDGKWLVFDSNLAGNSDLYRLPLDGGVPERLTDNPAGEFCGEISPDGRELVFHSFRSGSRDIFVQDLKSGAVAQVTNSPGQEATPRWSPDGSAIVAWQQQNVPDGGIFVLRRGSGTEWRRTWFWHGEVRVPVWSPDGRTIAFIGPVAGTVEAIPSDSGATRTLYSPRQEDPPAEGVEWSADGETLYFKGRDPSGRSGIWAVPVRGGRPRLLIRFDDPSRPSDRSNRPDFASDGRRFFFTIDDRQSDVWVANVSNR